MHSLYKIETLKYRLYTMKSLDKFKGYHGIFAHHLHKSRHLNLIRLGYLSIIGHYIRRPVIEHMLIKELALLEQLGLMVLLRGDKLLVLGRFLLELLLRAEVR
jgi:hypothetical protein